jgi:hypothetical protein
LIDRHSNIEESGLEWGLVKAEGLGLDLGREKGRERVMKLDEDEVLDEFLGCDWGYVMKKEKVKNLVKEVMR